MIGFAYQRRLTESSIPHVESKRQECGFLAFRHWCLDAIERVSVFEQVSIQLLVALFLCPRLAHHQLRASVPRAAGEDADRITVGAVHSALEMGNQRHGKGQCASPMRAAICPLVAMLATPDILPYLIHLVPNHQDGVDQGCPQHQIRDWIA